jgi:hypothetical protein
MEDCRGALIQSMLRMALAEWPDLGEQEGQASLQQRLGAGPATFHFTQEPNTNHDCREAYVHTYQHITEHICG